MHNYASALSMCQSAPWQTAQNMATCCLNVAAEVADAGTQLHQ